MSEPYKKRTDLLHQTYELAKDIFVIQFYLNPLPYYDSSKVEPEWYEYLNDDDRRAMLRDGKAFTKLM